MQSLYLEQRTWLHRWVPGLKLLGLAVTGSVLFLTEELLVLALAAGVSTVVFLSLGRPALGARRLVLSVLIAASLVAGFHACLGQVTLGLASAARLLTMTMLGVSLSMSTSHTEMLGVFERLLSPLGCLGFRVDRISLQLALMIRFTEHFFIQWKRLDDAHRVRTGRSGGWRLIPPLSILMLVAARRVGDALQLRMGK
jgi:biotin transport system permease protein